MRSIRHFWIYFFIAIGFLFLFLTNDFGLVDVQRTAIITGLAIDRAENDLVVTADLAVPSSSTSGENTSPLQVSSQGKTVAEALERIGNKLGWAPKLVYCNILLLGEETVKQDVFEVLDFFLRDEYFSDNCLVACTAGKAADVLSVQTPIDNIVTLALQKIISGEAYATGRCSLITLKDFSIGYYSHHKSGYLPMIQVTDPIKSVASTEEQKEMPSEKGQIFNVNRTALFYKGRKCEELDEEETFTLNLLRERLRNSAYSIEYEGETYCLNLKSNDSNIAFRIDNGLPKMTVNISMRSNISDKNSSSSIKELSSSTQVPLPIRQQVQNSILTSLSDIFKKSKSSNCDVFRILDELKRKESDYYDAYKNNILKMTIPEFNVTITSAKK